MINLLPPETKRQIRAARTNVVLYNYCLLILATTLLLGGVFAVGFLADMDERQVADKARLDSQAAAATQAKTRTAAESFAKDLATAKTILGSNVSFSQLILDIAAVVPPGVILNNLTLGGASKPDAPIDISGRATSYNGAINLKNSLEASPIFEKVNIVSVSQADASTSTQASPIVQRYPFVITLKAQFTKNATQGASK